VILYAHTITARLQYISDFIANEIMGNPCRIITNAEEFEKAEGLKINYSQQSFSIRALNVQPHSLLFDSGIRRQEIRCSETIGLKMFFHTGGELPFDIFAASFYLLSRYEEYMPHEKDPYGRYAPENSVAFNEGFLHIPLINYWLKFLKKILQQKYPDFRFHFPVAEGLRAGFIPTYDIDEAWSYKHKSRLLTLGGITKAFVKGKWSRITERRRVLNGHLPDPYESYEWLDALHDRSKVKPRYFFLVPGKTGKYDRNILPGEKALQELIQRHAQRYSVGIHPSWQSGDNPELLRQEINTLEKITGKKISSSRQHFIRFTLPNTFRDLISAQINEDFSMGYGSINGFRASVASPFYWYDLEKEKATALLMYPFCFMEATSFFEQEMAPSEAAKEMQTLYDHTTEVDGTFISIWHNTFLGTEKNYAGWRNVYQEFLYNNGLVDSLQT
jgi:hypothetical protein